MMQNIYRVKAVIDLDAIYENAINAKKLLKPGVKFLSIVKADGYGHGACAVADTVDEISDFYGVAVIEEGIALREHGIKKPILILGYTPEPLYPEMIENDLRTTVFTYEMAESISRCAVKMDRTAKIHIAVDTGMGRIGFFPDEEAADIVKKISELDNIEIEGMFTHFATMDDEDKTKADIQYRRYMQFVSYLNDRSVNIPIKHISNSAAITERPEYNLDMVRDGICLYGMYPSDHVRKDLLPLKPAMSIKAYVAFVKTMPAGETIGYGGTYKCTRPTRIATVPVGYADGYPRALSNKADVIIHGKRVPIVGRICMDQFMVDVSAVDDIKVGDQVTLMGRDGDEEITVEELSGMEDSFNYEFVCDVGKRVPREYIRHGKVCRV